MFISDTSFYVVDSLHVSNVRAEASVRQSPVLRDALRLDWTEIRQGILAWIVIELVMSHERANRKDGCGADQARPNRSNVVGSNLRALIRVAHNISVDVGDVEIIKRVRSLKPRAGVVEIQVDSIFLRELIIEPVKYFSSLPLA